MRKTPVSRRHRQINDVDAVLNGMPNMTDGPKNAIKEAASQLNDISRAEDKMLQAWEKHGGKAYAAMKQNLHLYPNSHSKKNDPKLHADLSRAWKKLLPQNQQNILDAKAKYDHTKKKFERYLDDEKNRSTKRTLFKKGTTKSDNTNRQGLLFALKTLQRQQYNDKQFQERTRLLTQMRGGLRQIKIPNPPNQHTHTNLKKFIQNPENTKPLQTGVGEGYSGPSGGSITGTIIDRRYRSGQETKKRSVDTSNLTQKDINGLLDKYEKLPGCHVARWYEGKTLHYKIISEPTHTHFNNFCNDAEKLNNTKQKTARMNLNKKKTAEMGINPPQKTQAQLVENKSTSRLSAKRKRPLLNNIKNERLTANKQLKKRQKQHRRKQHKPVSCAA